MRPTHVLFDLDGTLMDSSPGILACFSATLADIGRTASEAQLRQLIGPPLRTSFARLGVPEDALDEVVALYRSYYAETGVAMASLYPYVRETLEMLAAEGTRLAVATAKRVDFAKTMLETCGVAPMFDVIAGASLDLIVTEKFDIMSLAMASWPTVERARTWMVGDRDYDIAAALRHRVTPIGVLWGFGSRGELVSSGAAAVVSHAYELLTLSVSPTFGPSNDHYAGTAE